MLARSLGKVFAGILVFQVFLMILPRGDANTRYDTTYTNQASVMIDAKKWGQIQEAGINVVYVACIVLPCIVALETKSLASNRFLTGFGLWLIAKGWQAFKHAYFGQNMTQGHPFFFRVFNMTQQVVEQFAWGVMASSLVPA